MDRFGGVYKNTYPFGTDGGTWHWDASMNATTIACGANGSMHVVKGRKAYRDITVGNGQVYLKSVSEDSPGSGNYKVRTWNRTTFVAEQVSFAAADISADLSGRLFFSKANGVLYKYGP